MIRIKKRVIGFLPLLFFFFLSSFLFLPYFLKGQVPVPGDILLGHYYPWKDEVWQGRTAGYPIKNFILYDGIRQTLPWRLLAIDQIKSGKFPLWNQYSFSGTPLLANLQTAALYPLNLLFAFLSPLDAWTIYIILQPILACSFAYFFLRTITVSKNASLLGGVCYGFALIMANHLEFGIDGHTALWLPLSLGCINKIQLTGKKKWGMIFSFSILMNLLAGYPPPLVYNLILIFCYTIFKIRPLFSKKLLTIIFFGTVAVGITATQILPVYELAKKVIRDSDFGITGGNFFLPIKHLSTMVAPDFFGHPSTGNFFSDFYHVDNPSIGVIGLLFSFFGLLTFIRRRETKFWIFFAILPILFMTNTPLGKIIGNSSLSFFSLVTPLRMSWIVIFALAVLAGIGFDFFLSLFFERTRKNYLLLCLPFVLVAEFIVILWTISFIFLKGSNAAVSQRNLLLPTFFVLSSFFLLSLIFCFPKKIKIISFLFVCLASAELLRQSVKYNPFIDKSLVFPKVEILEKIKDPDYRTIVTNQEMLPANSNIPYLLPMIDGYAPMHDGRYGQMVKIANFQYPVAKIENYQRIVFQTQIKSEIINLLGVKYILTDKEINDPQFDFIYQKGRTKLYENKNAYPKAFLINEYSLANNDLDTVNQMLTSDLKKKAIFEEDPEFVNQIDAANAGRASLIKNEGDKLIVKVDTSSPAILMINNSFDKGWKATVDKKMAKIYRADYDLLAVTVPAGNHEVKIYYFPDLFKYGVLISLVSIVIYVIYLFL